MNKLDKARQVSTSGAELDWDVKDSFQKHRNTHATVPCPCSTCKGQEQLPRTRDDHLKREKQRAAALGVSPRQATGSSRRTESSSFATAHRSSTNRAGSPSSNRSDSPGNASAPRVAPPPSPVPSLPARIPPQSPNSYPGSSRSSLRSFDVDEDHSRHSSPGIQHLIDPTQKWEGSDGNLSDLAAEMDERNEEPGYFDHLLDQEDEQDAEHMDIEFEEIPDTVDHGDDSDVDPNDEEFGLPEGPPHVPAAPQFELNNMVPPEDDPGGNDSDHGDEAEPDYAAFDEPDIIRNIYVDAFIQKTHHRTTHSALKHQLKSAKRTISSHPDVLAADLDKMAQTIRTAEKRLGLSTRDIITTHTLCPVCHRRYDHSYIATAQEDTCINIGCTGVLFTEKVLATGERRRVSNLTYPTGSIIAWLKRMFLQPGIAELMQSWRTQAEDTEEFTPPISADEWVEARDPNEPLGDISEGYAWRERHAGLREGGILVYDDTELDPPVRFSSLPFGILLSMNTDW
ncbi:hypothetical protein RhiJN_24782 [Ceratobasidium sp. AG-Ba]|nr:hypothetical protein RhiJN_24782 [Ceratobasidium sp. AG-Ba]